jgi:hypothetical protein
MGTCAPWATEADVCSPCDDYDFDPALLDLGLQIASDVLNDWLGGAYPGECTDLIRPTATCACHGTSLRPWVPPGVATGGLWGCACSDTPAEVILPGYPATSIMEVIIDGQVVDPARYELQDRRRLVWLTSGPRVSWPCCQRLDRPAGEPGTWSVEYGYGQGPPAGGVRAAAVLGCEIAMSCDPGSQDSCRLDPSFTGVARQGVSGTREGAADLFPKGISGLPIVDLWVQSQLIRSARRPARAWVPGKRRRERRTTT